MTSEKDTMADELAEKVWQALARHGTLLDDIERRSVAEALSTTPANDARTPDDVVDRAALAILAEEELSDFIRGTDNEGGFEPLPAHSALSWAKAFARAALTATDDARTPDDVLVAASNAIDEIMDDDHGFDARDLAKAALEAAALTASGDARERALRDGCPDGLRDQLYKIAEVSPEVATVAYRAIQGFDAMAARYASLREEIINTPETADFMAGVPLEAAHQRERWGADHDVGKGPLDWFWLIGYLAQKAASAVIAGDVTKALHHTISTAAALANWHAALSGKDNSMRPGIDDSALLDTPTPAQEGKAE